MNILALIKDLENQNVVLDLELEKLAQYHYAARANKGHSSIPKSWLIATLEMLDKSGYVVKLSEGMERSVQINNVVSLRKKV